MSIKRLMPSCALGALFLVLSTGFASSSNLITNGDFSAGDTGFNTAYGLTTSTPLFQGGTHGIYAILPIGSVALQSAYGDWTNVAVDPSGGNGKVFAADGATNPNTVVWQETVAVNAHTNYVFSFDAAEISNACCSNAVFVPTIDGTNGTAHTLTGGWEQYTFSWNSGSNTTANLSLTDTNTSGPYNDFVLDDLSLQAAVPEPSTWAMMVIGFLGLGFMVYRRRNIGPSFA